MSEAVKPWAETWAANQQAMLKSMFSLALPPAANASGENDASTPLPIQQQFADLQTTWKESIEKWSEFAKEGLGAEALTAEALKAVFAPSRWNGSGLGAFDGNLHQALEGPKYATLWDLDRKLAKLQQQALQRDKDVAAYQAIVQVAWNKAFEQFSQSFASAKTPPPNSWRALTDRWLEVANATLIDARRSEEFVQAQTRMLRSASDYRIQERAIAEAWCEAFHVPTRSEMDEVQRTVVELRRQVRLLQRQATPATWKKTGSSAASPVPKRRAASAKTKRPTSTNV